MINWFRRNKKQEDEYEEFDIYNNEIPLSTLVRWFIFDTGHGNSGADELVGLAPMSEEGAEKEAQDSAERVIGISALVSYIDFISDVSSTVFSSLGQDLSDELPEDIREETEEMLATLYKSIAVHTAIGAFSIANALGLIQITAVSSELGISGEIDDE